jgi:hypothetical protein
MPPAANVVVSNTAGPQVPVYFAGAKMLTYYPVSIPWHGMALNMTVQSYDGDLDYGLVACRRAVPDLDDLGDYVVAEHRSLVRCMQDQARAAGAADGIHGQDAAPVKRRRQRTELHSPRPAERKRRGESAGATA